jgi:hypothetical protein
VSQPPIVFIGSSTEGLKIAQAIQQEIYHSVEPKLWSQGLFRPSQGSLNELATQMDQADFGILVLTPDDVTQSRSEETSSPRDNVIFELGLFIGRLGSSRCFFIYDQTINLKLPSDLYGITPLKYRPHRDGNLRAALGPACTSIITEIERLGPRPKLSKLVAQNIDPTRRTTSIAGKWARYSSEAPNSNEPVSILTIEQYGSFIHGHSVHKGMNGTRIFNYEGEFESGQLVVRFYDTQGSDYILGSMVLFLKSDAKTLIGRSTYKHIDRNEVVSEVREYKRLD